MIQNKTLSHISIYLDIDSVLNRFIQSALAVHSIDIKDVKMMGWHIHEWDGVNMTDDDFWRPIEALDSNFWRDIPKAEYADELVEFALSITDDVHFLSSPCNNGDSFAGKYDFIRKHWPSMHRKLIVAEDKFCCSKRNSILIDDATKHKADWLACGGKFVLFQQPYNSMTKNYCGRDSFELAKENLCWIINNAKN